VLSGDVEIKNVANAGADIFLEFLSGKVILDSSCTLGIVTIRGDCEIVDNSGVNCTVNDLRQDRRLDADHGAGSWEGAIYESEPD
jgi:hypothetical protein